jgi:cell division protein ZapA
MRMSTETSTLEVFILDKSYRINCPENEQESLRASAQYLDRKMREIRSSGKIIGLERIAVIAALNIAHELLNASQQAETHATDAADLMRLISKIDLTSGQKREHTERCRTALVTTANLLLVVDSDRSWYTEGVPWGVCQPVQSPEPISLPREVRAMVVCMSARRKA